MFFRNFTKEKIGTMGPSKFNDSKIFLFSLFQWNTGIMLIIRMISVFCCNHHPNEILELFCKYFIVSYSKHSARMSLQNNKKIFAKRFQYFIGMMITAKYRNDFDYQHNSCVSLEQWKQENLWIIVLALAQCLMKK